jgi:hypothetical protein
MTDYLFAVATAAKNAHPPAHNLVDWGKIGVFVAIIIPGLGLVVTAMFAYFRLGAVEKAIDNDIKPDIKSLRSKIDKSNTDLAGRIDKVHGILLSLKLDQSGAVENNSPRVLTEKGERILEESGIKEIVEDKLGDIITTVKDRKPENAYRAEQCIIEYVRELAKDKDLKERIETGAFNSGTTVDVVLFVGAIYIRDQVLAALDLPSET